MVVRMGYDEEEKISFLVRNLNLFGDGFVGRAVTDSVLQSLTVQGIAQSSGCDAGDGTGKRKEGEYRAGRHSPPEGFREQKDFTVLVHVAEIVEPWQVLLEDREILQGVVQPFARGTVDNHPPGTSLLRQREGLLQIVCLLIAVPDDFVALFRMVYVAVKIPRYQIRFQAQVPGGVGSAIGRNEEVGFLYGRFDQSGGGDLSVTKYDCFHLDTVSGIAPCHGVQL